jgi:hypothetical protein
MTRRKAQYRSDALLACLAAIETTSDLDDSARAECGFSSLGVPWSASVIMGRRAASIERRALRRAAAELEADGLIVRILDAGTGERLTHYRLTKDGFTQAVELAAGQAALDVIADVLDGAAWGRPLAKIARKLLTEAATKNAHQPAAGT